MLVLPLKIHRRAMAKFKRKAKSLFPVECFAYLLGNKDVSAFEVTDVWIPEDMEKHSTNFSIHLQDSWVPEVLDYCEEHDLTPLGSIHSHPYTYAELRGRNLSPDHSPSEADSLSGITSEIHGICRIVQSRSGRLRATVKFWGPEIPVEEHYI